MAVIHIPAGTLTGPDLGRPVRVEADGVTLEGTLASVSHRRKLIRAGVNATLAVWMPDGRVRVETVDGGLLVELGDTPPPAGA